MRLKPEDRYNHILDAAIRVAERSGYRTLTRQDVAEEAGVSPGLVSHYYLYVELLRMEVLAKGVERGVLPIVAEGLVAGELVARRAPEELRQRAAVSLMGGGV
jgi:hypothetical protein